MQIFLLIFVRGLRGPYGKGVVGHSLNPPLAAAAERRAVAPLLLGARHPPLLIDLPSARRSAANPQHAASASNDGTDGRTDGRTPERYREPAPHTMRAVPIIDVWKRCKKLQECVQYRMHETANT